METNPFALFTTSEREFSTDGSNAHAVEAMRLGESALEAANLPSGRKRF
jgi:hypothetical protein